METKPLKFVVYFDTDVSTPDAVAAAVIAEARAAALKLGDMRVMVSGNTDRAASDRYNQVLSELRAQAVAKAMVAGGVPEKAVSVLAYGESNPLLQTADGVSAFINRRVEILVEAPPKIAPVEPATEPPAKLAPVLWHPYQGPLR